MQNLANEQLNYVTCILQQGRQWSRHCRIGFAKRMLKLAYSKRDQEEISMRKIVLRRLAYDYVDKASARIRE